MSSLLSDAGNALSRGGRGRWTAALLAVALAAGCRDVVRPPDPAGGHLFDRYAALGNSITAGFQSAGINDSTQRQSYVTLLAQSMGTAFHQPLLNAPGCPPPVVNIFTGQTVGGASAPPCALRDADIPFVINDVAVPGAAIIDPLTNLSDSSSANALTTLMLGGRTQLEAAREVRPTFVTMWLGNNDVLGAALAGDTTLITPPATFADRYGAVADSIAGFQDLEGAVLVGVANVTLIPNLSLGAAWWQADQQGQLPPNFSVDGDCAPSQFGGVGEEARVPFAYGFGVLLARAQQGQTVHLDCVTDAPVLNPDEVLAVNRAVAAFNQTIQQVAQDRGWAYFDPNGLLLQEFQAGNIPVFPNTSGAEAVTEPFGPFFSKDGVHPSLQGHREVAAALVDVINQAYGTDLQPPQ